MINDDIDSLAGMLADVLERGARTAAHPAACYTCGVEVGDPCGPVTPDITTHPSRLEGNRVLALTLLSMATEVRSIRKRWTE